MLPPLAEHVVRWRANSATFDAARFDREAEILLRHAPPMAWRAVLAMHALGKDDRAFAWLARSPKRGATYQWSILFASEVAPLRRDPRLFAAMAELGLVDLWLARGRWPDFCSEPGLRYDCRSEAARMGKARRNAA